MSACPIDPRFERLERLLRAELSDLETARAFDHLQGCAACQAERAGILADRALLAALGSTAAASSVVAARAHQIVARARRAPETPSSRLLPGALAAAAALVIATLVLRPWSPGAPARPAPSRPAAHANPAPVAPTATSTSAPLEVVLASGMPRPDVAGSAPSVDVPRHAQLGLRLADGSALAFAGGSRATIQHGADGVTIELASGQVECRVAKQRGRAFVVRAPGVEARVHGTRFVVRADGSDVVVLEGRVEVRREGAAPVLVDGAAVPAGVEPAAWLAEDASCGARPADDTGELVVAGTGELLVDGMRVGTAPAVLRCATGPHRIERLVGRSSEETTVVVEERSVASVGLAPAPATEIVPERDSVSLREPAAEVAPPAPALDGETETETATESGRKVAEARRLLAARQYAEAQVALDDWLDAHPGDLRALFLLGEAQRLGGDAAAAERTFERVVAGGAGLPVANALTSLAFLAERRGPAAALAAWDRYLAAEPHGSVAAEALLRRANALVSLGRRPEARAALERFLREYPAHPRRAEVERRLSVEEN